MNSIDHPNILKLYEFFEEEKRIYLIIAMGNGLDLFDEI
jgi:calcium-dependent protein kinase